jgi:AcrR family transcriptional regulator
MSGLRERKKEETRQRISDVATGLFLRRGFDHVSVAEIAAAADVSKMTVFNYFPRKEDLFFDRIPAAAEMLTSTVRDRAPGVTPVAAVRAQLLKLVEQRHPLSAVGGDYRLFMRTVLDSPALMARAREAGEELEESLAGALADFDGLDPVSARMTAGLILSVMQGAYRTAVARRLAGDPVEVIAAEQPALINRWFDVLERGLTGADAGPGKA